MARILLTVLSGRDLPRADADNHGSPLRLLHHARRLRLHDGSVLVIRHRQHGIQPVAAQPVQPVLQFVAGGELQARARPPPTE
jgi:hypothetical protein